jgi:cytochrome c oxidase subunit 2
MMEHLIEQASSYAAEVDRVIWVVAVLGGFWLFLSEAVLFYFLLRFRRGKQPKAHYMTGETHREKAWIHWPHNLVILCDVVIVAFAMSAWYNIKQDLPPADATIRVVGQQWAWRFVHPGSNGELGTKEDVETMDELHLQVNKTYHFKLESSDVLHSFSVPVFRLKQDAVPGRVITGWFKPTKIGEYDIQCAEICGIGHGVMVGKLIVQSEDDYAQWIAAKRLSNSVSSQ